MGPKGPLLSPRIKFGERLASKIQSEETPRPSTWNDRNTANEIESSLVSEYGLATKQKPDEFGFMSVFANDDDAKVQALRRLTIEPTQTEATVSDSAALASALLDGNSEENFFDFGNFSEIPESPASRLSLSRAFRQNSSPLPKKPFLTPNHSPIQVATPLNAVPISIPTTRATPVKKKKKTPKQPRTRFTPQKTPKVVLSPLITN